MYNFSLFKKNIDRFFEENTISNSIATFDTKNITECKRRILYRCYGINEVDKNNYNDFLSDAIREKWLNFLCVTPNIKLKSINYVVGDCNFNISGTIDAVLRVNEDLCIFSFYRVNDDYFSSGIYRKEIVDTISKMWLSEIKFGVILLDNFEMQKYKIENIEVKKSVISSVCNKCKELNEYKIRGKLPDRSYKSKEKECLSCEFLETCWKGKNETKKEN